MASDGLDLEGAADQRFNCVIDGIIFRDEQLGLAQVANAWCETKPQKVHQTEDMIGETVGIGVVLLDSQIELTEGSEWSQASFTASPLSAMICKEVRAKLPRRAIR